jgi:hypothetical protein
MMVVPDNSLKFREKVDFPGTLSKPHNSLKAESVFSRCINSVFVSILKKLFAHAHPINGWY